MREILNFISEENWNAKNKRIYKIRKIKNLSFSKNRKTNSIKTSKIETNLFIPFECAIEKINLYKKYIKKIVLITEREISLCGIKI